MQTIPDDPWCGTDAPVGQSENPATAVAAAGLTGTDTDTPARVQEAIARRHARHGLGDALALLFAWCGASGYLPAGLWDADELLTLPDPETGTPLQLQINRSRARYQSPAAGFAHDQAADDCPLCIGNVGRPGKELLRTYTFKLAGRPFFIQHTPFPLYRGHYVLIDREHYPMRMDRRSLEDLAAFLDEAPGFTACSNSDIMWAGASILAHHHYQVFPAWRLPVMDAPADPARACRASGGARCAMLRYPAAVLRAEGPRAAVIDAAAAAIDAWKASAPGKATANLVVARGPATGTLAAHVMLRDTDHRTAPDLRAWKAEGVGVLEMAGMVIVPAPRGDDADARLAWLHANATDVTRGIIRSNSPDPAATWEILRPAL